MPYRTRTGAVLTPEDHERIAYLYDQGKLPRVEIAEMFGCSTVSVWRIAHRTRVDRCAHCGAALRPPGSRRSVRSTNPGQLAR
jgi:transposase-like protein